MKKAPLQRTRVLAQIGFFALFTLTPLFDLFRYDLTQKHAYFLTYPWHLGIDELIAGTGDPRTAAINIILYLFLPILGAGVPSGSQGGVCFLSQTECLPVANSIRRLIVSTTEKCGHSQPQ